MCGEAISDERSDRRPVLLEPQIFASWRTVAAEQATDRRPFPNVSTQQPEPLSEVGWGDADAHRAFSLQAHARKVSLYILF